LPPASSDQVEKKAIFQLGFLGNLKTSQNFHALQWIVSDVLPVLDGLQVSYRLNVIGPYVKEEMSNILADPRLNFSGPVEDAVAALAVCDVAILPVLQGTGIKTKILDAMAAGVPVVTNGIGAEGLSNDYKSCPYLMIGESADELARLVGDLLNSKSLRHDVSSRAIEYVSKFHSPETLCKKYRAAVFGISFGGLAKSVGL
jgi:glycosyltransferase involved in cell wall biosynthesis